MSIGFRILVRAFLIALSLILAVFGLVIGTFLEGLGSSSLGDIGQLMIQSILRFGPAIVLLLLGLIFSWRIDERIGAAEAAAKSETKIEVL